MTTIYTDARMQAHAELDQEKHRAEVERWKEIFRTHKPWWHYLCPFVITIKRRD